MSEIEDQIAEVRERMNSMEGEISKLRQRLEELEEVHEIEQSYKLQESVLVVDDSRLVRTLITDILAGADYKVLEAENGVQALEVLESEECNLVIADIFMPDMDGAQLLRNIRLMREDIDLPVLVCSSSRTKEDFLKVAQYGVQGILQKPINKKELLEKVKTILQEAKNEGEASEESIDSEVFNLELALGRVEGDRKLLVKLLKTFLEDWPRLLANIRKSVIDGDAMGLRDAAHALKGVSASIGGESTATAAFRLEELGRDQNLETSRDDYSALESEIHRLKEALDQYLIP